MIIGWSRDKHFEKRVHKRLRGKRISTAGEACRPSTSGLSRSLEQQATVKVATTTDQCFTP